MKILIAGLVKNIQIERLKEEGLKRGHVVEGCYAPELIIYSDKETFEPTLRGRDLSKYDLIYLMVGSKRRWEWYTTALYLNKKHGTIIVNNKAIDPNYNYFMSPALEYMKQTENKLPYPASAVVFADQSVEHIIGRFRFPVIVKFANGRKGNGVFMARSLAEVEHIIDINKENSPAFVIREFIPNDGDLRIFTVGYKAIGAMKRIPKEGDFRSNISQGGSGLVFDLKKYPEIQKIAEKLSEITRTEIAGVDIIIDKNTDKPYILEINPSPQFAGFEQYTKVNAAEAIIKYFEGLQK